MEIYEAAQPDWRSRAGGRLRTEPLDRIRADILAGVGVLLGAKESGVCPSGPDDHLHDRGAQLFGRAARALGRGADFGCSREVDGGGGVLEGEDRRPVATMSRPVVA